MDAVRFGTRKVQVVLAVAAACSLLLAESPLRARPAQTGQCEGADLEKAVLLLTEMQDREYARLRLPPPDANAIRSALRKRLADQKLASDLRELLETWLALPLPTSRENPVSYAILHQRVTSVRAAAVDTGYRKVPVIFGTLPVASVHAVRRSVPGSSCAVVAVDAAAFIFVHELAKIALDTIYVGPATRGGDSDAWVIKFDIEAFEQMLPQFNVAERLRAMLHGFLTHRFPDRPGIREEVEPLLAQVDDAMEMFFVGHELGHVVHNHEAELIKPDRASPCSNRFEFTWKHELEADLFALHVTIAAAERQAAAETKPSYANELVGFARRMPILLFALTEILDDATQILERQSAGGCQQPAAATAVADALAAATPIVDWKLPPQVAQAADGWPGHPPHSVRRELLVRALAALPTRNDNEGRIQFAALADQLSANVKRVWEMRRSTFPKH